MSHVPIINDILNKKSFFFKIVQIAPEPIINDLNIKIGKIISNIIY